MKNRETFEPGQTITLDWVSRKGQQRLKQAGTTSWKVIRSCAHVDCLWGAPGLFVEPITHAPAIREELRRWIKLEGDKDFQVIS